MHLYLSADISYFHCLSPGHMKLVKYQPNQLRFSKLLLLLSPSTLLCWHQTLQHHWTNGARLVAPKEYCSTWRLIRVLVGHQPTRHDTWCPTYLTNTFISTNNICSTHWLIIFRSRRSEVPLVVATGQWPHKGDKFFTLRRVWPQLRVRINNARHSLVE